MRPLKQLPREHWQETPPDLLDVWVNERYVVFIRTPPSQEAIDAGVMAWLTVRSVAKVNGMWYDRIPWDELQDLKNQAGFDRYDAIEIFPAERDRLQCEMRQLYVLGFKLPFAWRHQEPPEKHDDTPADPEPGPLVEPPKNIIHLPD